MFSHAKSAGIADHPVILRTGINLVLAFEISEHGFNVGDGIAHFTNSRICHVETWSDGTDPRRAVCWGARPPVVEPLILDLTDRHWVTLGLPELTLEQRQTFDAFCRATRGAKYDTRGVASFMAGFLLGDNLGDWFCSEWSCRVLKDMGILPINKPSHESPVSELWRLTGFWPETEDALLRAADAHNGQVWQLGWKAAIQDASRKYPG